MKIGFLVVGLFIVFIGVFFGGFIGYVINLVCDFFFCIVYVVLLIKGKGDSDWGYVWVLVVGLMIGVVLVVFIYFIFW